MALLMFTSLLPMSCVVSYVIYMLVFFFLLLIHVYVIKCHVNVRVIFILAYVFYYVNVCVVMFILCYLLFANPFIGSIENSKKEKSRTSVNHCFVLHFDTN